MEIPQGPCGTPVGGSLDPLVTQDYKDHPDSHSLGKMVLHKTKEL